MSIRILHLISRSHITEGFPEFLQTLQANDASQVILQSPGSEEWPSPICENVHLVCARSHSSWLFHFLRLTNKADRIFVHGLAGGRWTSSLALVPWLLRRCYWLIWGADLYAYQRRNQSISARCIEPVRRFVIKRFGHLVTYLPGDIELARRWYGARGISHHCLLYSGNTAPTYIELGTPSTTQRVLVGNSADPGNSHLEIFRALSRIEGVFEVVAPLAYGDQSYRDSVVAAGETLFGSRFVPILDLLPIEQYREYLSSIDIAIFNHRRQQAMGNTIALLAMGKRVFIRRSTSQWKLFVSLQVRISAVEDGIDLAPLNEEVRLSNNRIVTHEFSRETLAEQWSTLIEVGDDFA